MTFNQIASNSDQGCQAGAQASSTVSTLTLVQPDDWHLHVRDGAMLQSVIADTARQFGRAIIMPNLLPPVTTTEMAGQYRLRIFEALRRSVGMQSPLLAFQPLMTLYLTDNTPPQEIQRAKESGFVHGVKLYPAGATTNSEEGVTDLFGRCIKTLEKIGRASCREREQIRGVGVSVRQ